MGSASYSQSSFLGGEISKSYSGRYDLPAYRMSLAVCLNWLPIDTGALARRGGTQHCGTTRRGFPGRNIAFDVSGANPIYLEFTDLFLRFRLGPALVTTNDQQVISSITTDNPAKVNTVGPHGWADNDEVIFPGINMPLLQNRRFLINITSATQFTIFDDQTENPIDGSTLGSFTAGNAARILEITTSYGAGSWQAVRSVQAESQTVLLSGQQPQVLTLVTPPSSIAQPTFALAPSNFLDGPYLDPFPGSICTYDVLSGNVTLTFSFQAYSATVSYNVGDFVTSSGQGYKSLTAANEGNTPASNPTNWLAVNGGAPVGPNGFTSADIGRHIRLFSEPPDWAAGTYAATNVVKYNGAYYQSVVGTNTAVPGTDATKWAVVSGAAYAVWTWGRILSVSGAGLINPSVAIGNYTSLSAAFDGTTTKAHGSCASASTTVTAYPVWAGGTGYGSGSDVYYLGSLYQSVSGFTVWAGETSHSINDIVLYSGTYYKALFSFTGNGNPPSGGSPWASIGVGNPSNSTVWTYQGAASNISLDDYAGQDFHTSTKQIAYATVFPSTDNGFGTGLPGSFVLNLRAKATSPANASDGTVIGTSGAISNGTAPVTITSTDTSTHWAYVWVEMVASATQPLPDQGGHQYTMASYLGQVEFFGANVNNGSVVTIQLAGPALLYPGSNASIVNTWRAGVYSNGAGWPTCGTYAEGRLWLGGVVDNRFDTSMADDIFVFSPTGPDGTVADNNAISYTLNAPDVNPILWMLPDLQGILMGTQKREWLVQPASTASGLAPGNIVGNPATHIGCANIEPRRTDHTIVFVQKHQRKIMEAFADIFSGKFTAPNLMEKARHLSAASIEEIAYQQELVPVIWARCGDGSFFGLTYKRDTLMTSQGPTFLAPHRHALGSGRLVESIAVGPSPDGTLDALMLVTNDPATNVRHVELMTDYFEEVDVLQSAWQLDDAAAPSSTSISTVSPAPYGGMTINGLWHLNGKTVSVFAGGLDCGDYTVASGSIVVPFGDGVSAGTANGLFTAAFVASFTPSIPIVVGFVYNSDVQLLRPNTPQETGARNGPAFGKKRRNHDYALQVVNTHGLSIGTSFAKLLPIIWMDDSSASYPANQLFSGVQSSTFDLQDDYSFDGQICWRATRMLPAMVTAAGGFIETQDR